MSSWQSWCPEKGPRNDSSYTGVSGVWTRETEEEGDEEEDTEGEETVIEGVDGIDETGDNRGNLGHCSRLLCFEKDDAVRYVKEHCGFGHDLSTPRL